MLSVRNIVFLAVAVTGSVIRRDAAQVKSDLQLINADTQAVTAAVNNYNGGGYANALPIVGAQSKLSDDIKAATDHAKAAGGLSEADADAIVGYIRDTLQPSIQASLSALKSKRDKFAGDGLSPIVKSSLGSLKMDTDNLSAALVAGTPPSRVSEAKAVSDAIDASFDDAIAYFS
ncbi:hypothetical protein EsDP_00006679 [Epichloe bromicola]|uniref:Hydrophobic surface binding protein n=1 Tax=Epichloe bromicola TaxID=79588 RepID=A0ABQ0CYB7_9HYPO